MARIVLILLIITALSLGCAWIGDQPGHVAVDWGDYHIETSVLVVLAGIAIAALWCMIAYYIVYALLLSPRTWLRSRLAKRQQHGLEALTRTFAAIATQDIRAARKQIKRAQHYLPHQPLTLMLASQVARLEGNESQSRLYLEQMLKAESTEFLALRGLVETARRNGDTDTALMHAEKAIALKPKDPWLNVALIGLYAAKQRTDEAIRLASRAMRKRIIGKKEWRMLTAGIFYEYARPLISQRRPELAISALHEALRHQPDLVPASALLAETYRSEKNLSRALKTLYQAWKHAPNPLLAAVLLKCFEPPETRKKVKNIALKMARSQPSHPESRYLLAAIALKEGHAETAQSEIKIAVEHRETVRGCILMAEAENALGDKAQATQWMNQSHSAVADPGYVCESCNRHAESWNFTCPQCGSVGSTVWK